MDRCCEVRPVEHRQRRVLHVVLWINLAMFALEFGAGLLAHSTALLADSVDMLGDAIVYGFSLYVIGRGAPWQARGALLKGAIMAAFAAGIAVEIVVKLARGITPDGDVMSAVAVVALAANGSVLWFLWRHRDDDLNMRSAWLCSRNDVLANAGVVGAAGAVWLTGSAWPDIAVGLAIAVLFGSSAVAVIRQALRVALASEPAVHRSDSVDTQALAKPALRTPGARTSGAAGDGRGGREGTRRDRLLADHQ